MQSKIYIEKPYSTPHGMLSTQKMGALLNLRHVCLKAIRGFLYRQDFLEVTPASIVNIAGSCENPHASFPLDFYGGEAYLSQSAQLQLEPIVLRLKRNVFSSSMSFRAENFEDPESPGRRLSEFTLIEVEMPFEKIRPNAALQSLTALAESITKAAIEACLESASSELMLLGGDVERLGEIVRKPFERLEWADIEKLHVIRDSRKLGDDLGIVEERAILAKMGGLPTFVFGHPPELKFFNIKRTEDFSSSFSLDLLLPPMGESLGGGLREDNTERLRQCLDESSVARFLRERGADPHSTFSGYFDLLETEGCILRGGFGLGFERFISFLTNSNDILHSVSYRSLSPNGSATPSS